MIRKILFPILLLSGCAASEPEEMVVIPPVPIEMPVIKPATPKPAVKVVTSDLSPKAILTAATQAKTDAIGYVGWKKSRPENIERLTTLTLNLDSAIKKMQTGKVGHHYSSGDVVAARSALINLQGFLQNKGD